jgi:ribosome assembly protein YihI (activator of Der GTPase)
VDQETFGPAMRAEMEHLVRGMAEARICRSAVVARDLLLKSLVESRAEQVLGPEDRAIVADTLDGINRLIERLGPRQGEAAPEAETRGRAAPR